jgi:hypothetical protein
MSRIRGISKMEIVPCDIVEIRFREEDERKRSDVKKGDP